MVKKEREQMNEAKRLGRMGLILGVVSFILMTTVFVICGLVSGDWANKGLTLPIFGAVILYLMRRIR